MSRSADQKNITKLLPIHGIQFERGIAETVKNSKTRVRLKSSRGQLWLDEVGIVHFSRLLFDPTFNFFFVVRYIRTRFAEGREISVEQISQWKNNSLLI